MSGVINLATADVKNAKLTMKLSATSGYRAHFDYQVSANQWAAIIAICEDAKSPSQSEQMGEVK